MACLGWRVLITLTCSASRARLHVRLPPGNLDDSRPACPDPGTLPLFFFFENDVTCRSTYFWLCWVFLAVQGVSLAVESRASSLAVVASLLQSVGSGHAG